MSEAVDNPCININEAIFVRRKTRWRSASIKCASKIDLPYVPANYLLIRVEMCGISFQDILLKNGFAEFENEEERGGKMIMGTECAGTVVEVGSSLDRKVWVGKRVLALPESGAWQRYVSVHRQDLILFPTVDACGRTFELPFTDAVGMGLHYMYADHILGQLDLQPQSKVIIFSAGGAMGIALAQFCKNVYGATVFGVTSKWKFEYLKPNDTRSFFDHLYAYEDDYNNLIRRQTGSSQPLDVVLDGLSVTHTRKSTNLLKDGGLYIYYGHAGGFVRTFRIDRYRSPSTSVKFDTSKVWWQRNTQFYQLLQREVTVQGIDIRYDMHGRSSRSYKPVIHDRMQRLFNDLTFHWLQKRIGPFIHWIYPLEQAQDAMLVLERRWNIGKVLLNPNLCYDGKGLNIVAKLKQMMAKMIHPVAYMYPGLSFPTDSNLNPRVTGRLLDGQFVDPTVVPRFMRQLPHTHQTVQTSDHSASDEPTKDAEHSAGDEPTKDAQQIAGGEPKTDVQSSSGEEAQFAGYLKWLGDKPRNDGGSDAYTVTPTQASLGSIFAGAPWRVTPTASDDATTGGSDLPWGSFAPSASFGDPAIVPPRSRDDPMAAGYLKWFDDTTTNGSGSAAAAFRVTPIGVSDDATRPPSDTTMGSGSAAAAFRVTPIGVSGDATRPPSDTTMGTNGAAAPIPEPAIGSDVAAAPSPKPAIVRPLSGDDAIVASYLQWMGARKDGASDAATSSEASLGSDVALAPWRVTPHVSEDATTPGSEFTMGSDVAAAPMPEPAIVDEPAVIPVPEPIVGDEPFEVDFETLRSTELQRISDSNIIFGPPPFSFEGRKRLRWVPGPEMEYIRTEDISVQLQSDDSTAPYYIGRHDDEPQPGTSGLSRFGQSGTTGMSVDDDISTQPSSASPSVSPDYELIQFQESLAALSRSRPAILHDKLIRMRIEDICEAFAKLDQKGTPPIKKKGKPQ